MPDHGVPHSWANVRKLLCIRSDNAGDVIMSGPAIRALKESLGVEITLLTSSLAAGIARQMPCVDKVIVFDTPWVKSNRDGGELNNLAGLLQKEAFDAAVIFTVFSQSPLPQAMICYLAGISLTLAWCHENPYGLLSNWVPDPEPFKFIRHQVRRDLDLVATIGSRPACEKLQLNHQETNSPELHQLLARQALDLTAPYLLIHCGVTEAKRQYPGEKWKAIISVIRASSRVPILLTGSGSDAAECATLAGDDQVLNLCGKTSTEEFVALIARARLLLAVNTAASHIAAAFGVPQIVLYAKTNPQHTPWQSPAKVYLFDIPSGMQSRNEVLVYLSSHYGWMQKSNPAYPDPQSIAELSLSVLSGTMQLEFLPETIYQPQVISALSSI